MKIIKCLVEKIEEEMHDADSYIDLAMSWKEEEPVTADLFYQLSLEEMGHADKLHVDVARLINGYRQQKGDPPADMQALYSYLHKKHIEEALKIKVKQGMFKS